MTPNRDRTSGRDRGQTAIDFALGMGVFLLALAFTFGALPSLFEPFEEPTGTQAVVADRSADRLTEDLLVASPSQPSILNETCTEAFFAEEVREDCRYETSSDDLQTALGTSEWRSLNVTIKDDAGVRTLNGTDLSAGPAPRADDDAIAAQRVVRLAGDRNRLTVRVW